MGRAFPLDPLGPRFAVHTSGQDFDLWPLAAAELLSMPIALAYHGPNPKALVTPFNELNNSRIGLPATHIEISVIVAGEALSGVNDLTLSLYRCADGRTKDQPALATKALDLGNAAALGADLITNGDFALGTTWHFGDGWSISGGAADKAQTTRNSEIWQPISMTRETVYLARFTVATLLLDGVVWATVGATGPFGGRKFNLVEHAARGGILAAMQTNLNATSTATKFAVTSVFDTVTDLDAVVVKSVVPAYFSYMAPVFGPEADLPLGGHVVIGVTPGADLSSTTFVSVMFRRWSIL